MTTTTVDSPGSAASVPEAVAIDPRLPATRLSRLFDDGTLTYLAPPDDSGVVAARGLIDGRDAFAFCTDATRMGGAMGAAGCEHIVAAIDAAVHEGAPVIGLWHSGGARLADGVESMEAVGRVFAAIVHASGCVPQISVVLGPAAGAAAYGPALTDLIIMSEQGRIFITGPEVVRSVTGEEIDMLGLGGPEAHGRKSGVTHVVTATEDEAYASARSLASLLSAQGSYDLSRLTSGDDPSALLPDAPRRAYDVRPLIHSLLDPREGRPALDELQPHWAPNMVVGLGRLAGRTVGVVANNPLRKGGCLDSLSAEKAARFVRMCDSFGVPLVVIVDIPGYLPGVGQEWGGVVRRGAKLLYAFADCTVPRITLVTRKSYGGGYIAMNSRSLGATTVFAWPDAQVAVMGAEAAVGILYRKQLAAVDGEEREALRADLIERQTKEAGGVGRAAELGAVDEIIDPPATRYRLAKALADAPARRGHRGNPPQ